MSRRLSVLALAAGVPVALLLLAACGGGGDPSASAGTAAAAPSAAPSAGGGANEPGGNRRPAASGEIAAVSGTTLQVQNSSSQTAVTWSASTRFTKTVTATLAAGDCVTAVGTPGTSDDTLTATTVRVVSTSGSCTFDRAGGGGPGFPGGTPRARPSGGSPGGNGAPPSGGARPSGAPGGRDFATAFGSVKSVSGSTVMLSGTVRTAGRFRGRSPGATPKATPSATTVTVTLGSSATVERTVSATGADAKVGLCATATGKADSTGAVAATGIALTPKGANGCARGFGGRFPGGGFGG